MLTKLKVQARDVLRAIVDQLSIEIWEDVRDGKFTFTNSKYTWQERLPHYEKQLETHKGKAINHGIDTVLDIVVNFLPKNIVTLVKMVFKIIVKEVL